MDTLTLFAPLSGRIMPLDTVPDPYFSEKLAGEGLAIDPISSALLAPCEGQIIELHPALHALTISAGGIEIMMHIGLDTAVLQGEGFLPHVQVGDQVHTGQTLIEFDPSYVVSHATQPADDDHDQKQRPHR